MENVFAMPALLPLVAQDAGLMVSRGQGRHIERTAPYFVLLFVRAGTLHIQEEDTTFTVSAGQSLLLWPGRHHLGTRDFDRDLQFYWLHFTLPDLAPPTDESATTLSVPQHVTVARPDFVTELFRRYLHDRDTGHLQPLGAALYVWMILTEISGTYPASNTAAGALAGRAYAFIRIHFHEKISASDVALALGYNARYLGRVYQSTYGHTIAEAIRRARISHAKSLLMETNYNVTEIARQSGFDDATYFQRVFKQLEGMPALRFRRLHARMLINNG